MSTIRDTSKDFNHTEFNSAHKPEHVVRVDSITDKSRSSSNSIVLNHGQANGKWNEDANDDVEGNASHIEVVVRVRPMMKSEIENGAKEVTQATNDTIVLETNKDNKQFRFSKVFRADVLQEEFFQQCGICQLLNKALDGYSCTAFAFGQTGSGKTFTMTGPVTGNDLLLEVESQGLIQRAFQYIYGKMDKNPSIQYQVRASYVEIYNEQVQDLLNPSTTVESLQVRWSADSGFYIENAFVLECESVDDLIAVLEEGIRHRQIGSNAINDRSSRSHAILTIYIDSEVVSSEDLDEPCLTKHGKLFFVDLAGSEKVAENHKGENLAEAGNINKSLLTLGNCISALSDVNKRHGHIPYRESKLTKLLSDSLGGNGITLMIACIAPSSQYVSETLNSLRYANRTKKIKNFPKVHMDPKDEYIVALKQQLKKLRIENVSLRRQQSDSYHDAKEYQAIGTMSEQGTSNHYHYKIRNDQIRDQINSKIVSAKATSPILESFHDYQPPRNTHISPASDDDVQACRDILEAENSAHPRPHHQILQNSHVENITKSKTISESQDNHAINAQEGNKVIKRKKVKRKAKKNDRPSNLQSRPFIHESNQGMKAQNDIRQNDSFNLDKKLESIHKVTSLSEEAEIQLKSQNPSTYERNNLKQHDKEKTKQFTSQDKFHRQDPLENSENKQRKTHQLSDKRNEFNKQDDKNIREETRQVLDHLSHKEPQYDQSKNQNNKNINSEAQQSAHQKIVLGEAQLEENTHTYNKNIMPEKEYSDYDKSHTERQSDQQNYRNGNEYRQENILNKQTKLQSETSLRQPMLSNDYINQTAPSHETVSQLRQNITNKYGSDTESKQQNLLVTEGRKIYHQSASNVEELDSENVTVQAIKSQLLSSNKNNWHGSRNSIAAGKETMETPRRAAHLDISPESQEESYENIPLNKTSLQAKAQLLIQDCSNINAPDVEKYHKLEQGRQSYNRDRKMTHILQELLAENQKLREDILDLREENRVLLDDKKALIENDSKNKEQIMKLREEIRKEQKEKKNILEEKNSMIEKLRILQGILSNTPGHSPDYRDKYDGDKLVNESIDKGSPLPQITNRMSSLNNVGDDNEHNKKSYHSTTHFSDNQLHLDHKKKLKEFQHPDSKLENSIDSSMEKLAISDRGHIIDSRVPQSKEPSNLILKTVEASVTQDHNIPRDGAFSQTSSSYAATFPRQKLISNDHQWRSVEGNDRPLQQRQHDVEGKIMSSNPALVKTLVSSSANQNHAINNGNSPEAMKLYDLSYIRDIVNPYKHKKPKKAFKHGSVEQWEIKKSQIPKKQVPQSLYKSQDKQEEGYYGMYRFNQITKQLHRTVENRFFVRQPGLSTTVTSTMHPEQIYHFNEKLSQELKELDGQIRMYQDKPIKPE